MNAIANTPPTPETNGNRSKILWIITAVFLVLGALWWVWWLLVLSMRESTDDAYVDGDKVIISSQVPGTVVAIAAENTQLVNAGQVLVQLDPTDSASQLDRAASALAQAVRQVRQQAATADQYGGLILTRQRELARAQVDLERREPLLAEQAIAPEEIRHARDTVELARAALQQALRQSDAAKALVEGTDVAGLERKIGRFVVHLDLHLSSSSLDYTQITK